MTGPGKPQALQFIALQSVERRAGCQQRRHAEEHQNSVSLPLHRQQLGTQVGSRLAARYPQRISRLVLIGTSARTEFTERLPTWRNRREILLTGSEAACEALFTVIQGRVNAMEWRQSNPHEAARELNIMLSHSRSGLALDTAVFKRGDITHLLAKISAPTWLCA